MRTAFLALWLALPLVAHAQTVDLNLSNVTQDGGAGAFDTHYGFGGNETNLATGETQHYTNGNVSTANGAITLTAESNGQSGAITSGTETQGMPTAGGFTLNGYGTLNITASVPDGANLWGALWLEPVTSATNPKPSPCEIDIMESPFNTATKYQASLHDSGSGYTTGVNIGNLSQTNTYGVTITPSTISYLLNGQVVGQIATPASCQNQKFYLLANVAEGGWASQYANGQGTASGTMTISQIAYTPTSGGSASGGLIKGATTVATASSSSSAMPTASASSCPAPKGMTNAAFLQTIGVNIHLIYGGAYGNVASVEKALAYLGGPGKITVRDSTAAPQSELMALGKAGYKLDIYAAYNSPGNNSAATAINDLKPLVNAGYVRMIEGPLEVDNNGWGLVNKASYTALNGKTYTGWQAAVAWQKDLYSTFSGKTQVALFSLANPSDGAANSAAVKAAASLGTNLDAISDVGNVHFYEHGGNPPSTEMGGVIQQETGYTSGEGFVITESGFNDSPLGASQGYFGDDQKNAGYTTQLVSGAAAAGSKLTDLYELFDESGDPNSFEGHWGLFNADGSPKPAATALRNLIASCSGGSQASTAAVATMTLASSTATVDSSTTTPDASTTGTGDTTAAQSGITPGQGSVTDCKGNVWTIQTDGNRIKEGDILTPGGGGTSALTLQGCTVYGQDIHSGQWFTLSSNDAGADQYWTQSAAPSGETNQPVTQTPTPTTDPTTPSQNNCTAAAAGAGGFHVANGQIIGPNGQPWIARGINIYGPDAGTAAQTVTKVFTGVNFFRYIVRNYFDPGSVQGFVNQMTGEGRVVEFEDHPDGGGDQDAGPPQGMAAEMAWYSAMAKAYAGNPYVWFGTFNEPKPTSGLSAWQRTTYDAIRGAGNNNPIMLEVSGSRPSNLQQALNSGTYASMTNVLWDAHDYPYMNNYNKDPASITENINALITAAQTIRSADGLVPVIIGESGPSTTGLSLDPNGYATVEGLITVAQDGKMGGLAPFAWGTSTPNAITDNSGNPTSPYGQMVQIFINTDVVTPSKCQEDQQAQQTVAAAKAQLAPAQ